MWGQRGTKKDGSVVVGCGDKSDVVGTYFLKSGDDGAAHGGRVVVQKQKRKRGDRTIVLWLVLAPSRNSY